MDAELKEEDDQFIADEAYTGGPDVYDHSFPGGSAARPLGGVTMLITISMRIFNMFY